jgi:hypothetical protein
MFQAKAGNYPSDFSSADSEVKIMLPQDEVEDIKSEDKSQQKFELNADLEEDEAEKTTSGRRSLMSLNDASDELFDVPDSGEVIDFGHLENGWFPEGSQE